MIQITFVCPQIPYSIKEMKLLKDYLILTFETIVKINTDVIKKAFILKILNF